MPEGPPLATNLEEDDEAKGKSPQVTLQEKIDKAAAEGSGLTLTAEEAAVLKARLEAAATDPLTGLYNRQYLEEALDRSIAEAERSDDKETELSRTCVLFVDIDNFKDINDKLGHAAGDRYLISIAAHLKAAIRKEDIVARAGGDEFIIYLTDTDPAAILATSEKIRMAVVAASAEARAEEVRIYAETHTEAIPDDTGTVTASVGYAFYDSTRHKSADDVIRDADVAMYSAKETGRNKVVGYDPEKMSFGVGT